MTSLVGRAFQQKTASHRIVQVVGDPYTYAKSFGEASGNINKRSLVSHAGGN